MKLKALNTKEYMKFIHKKICIFLLICSIHANAQQGNSCPEDLFPFYDKEKKAWGYADMMGMMVIEPIFTKVSPYSSNKAIVQKGNLCGVLDCNGNLVVPVQYEKILNFRYNKAWAFKDGLWGLIDDKGRNVLAQQFTDMYNIQGTELTWVKKMEYGVCLTKIIQSISLHHSIQSRRYYHQIAH
jgi:hypothetical protein